MCADGSSNREVLLRLLSDVESQANELEQMGQGIARAARFTLDVVSPIRTYVDSASVDDLQSANWMEVAESWSNCHGSGVLLRSAVPLSTTTIYGTICQTATNTTFTTLTTDNGCRFSDGDLAPSAAIATEQLSRTINRVPLVDDVLTAMRRMRLDVASADNRASPTHLLNEAVQSLERPATTIAAGPSILVPLRECILATIAELLRRRPVQEPAPKLADKIASLGRQCARSEMPATQFEHLAHNGQAVLEQLSGSKQEALAREQLQQRFQRGLLFLMSLLNSLDEASFRVRNEQSAPM